MGITDPKTGRSRTAVAAMIIFVLIWLGQEAVAGKSLSFYMARNLLYERSDSLKAANANVESKDETRKSLKFLGGPTISAQAFEIYGETKIDIDKSVPTPLGSMPVRIDERYDFSGPRASISGTWPIFTGGKIQAAKKVSEFAVDEARAQRRAVSVELDTELIGKYFGLQLAVSLQKLREDMLRQQDRELARAIQFELQGMISHVERMGVQVARDAAERDYLKARDAKNIALLQLQRLLRDNTITTPTTPLFVASRAAIKPMDHWVRLALANNPQLMVVEAKIQQADQGVNSSRANWSPQIFAFGQYSLIREYQTAIEPTWLAGLGINFTIWDARDRLSAFRSARATLREARATHAEAINQVKTGTETAWLNSQNAREQYQLTASTIALARENLRLKSEGFAEGLSTALDVTEARDQLVAAEVERRMAAYEFVVNYALLHAIAGNMDEFMGAYKRRDVMVEK